MSPNWITWGEDQEALLYFLKQILVVLFLLFAVVFIGDPGKALLETVLNHFGVADHIESYKSYGNFNQGGKDNVCVQTHSMFPTTLEGSGLSNC